MVSISKIIVDSFIRGSLEKEIHVRMTMDDDTNGQETTHRYHTMYGEASELNAASEIP